MTRRLRLLLYNQSLTGTGHFVKTHELARALAPHHEVWLVDGGRPVPRPAPGQAFATLALPRIERRDGRVAAGDPAWSLPALWAERRRLLLDAVERLRPDALLVDQFPFFKWELRREIVPLIERLRAVRSGARVVCSTWELPRGTGREPRAPSPEQVKRAFRDHFDGLLVHADPRLLALEDHVPWADELGVPRVYTGYVSEKPPAPRPPPRTGAGSVLVSTGGASLPTLLRDSIEAWRRLRDAGATGGRTLFAFLPPFAPDGAPAGGPWPAAEPALCVEPFARDFVARLQAADLSISQAGYNTCTNLLETRVRAILVPNPATLDQVSRAQRMQELGLARCLDPAKADPDRIAAAIVEGLALPRPEHDLDLGGADATRRRLEELADGAAWH